MEGVHIVVVVASWLLLLLILQLLRRVPASGEKVRPTVLLRLLLSKIVVQLAGVLRRLTLVVRPCGRGSSQLVLLVLMVLETGCSGSLTGHKVPPLEDVLMLLLLQLLLMELLLLELSLLLLHGRLGRLRFSPNRTNHLRRQGHALCHHHVL